MKTRSLTRSTSPSAMITVFALAAAIPSIGIPMSSAATTRDDGDVVMHRIAVGGRKDRRVQYFDPNEHLEDDGRPALGGNDNHLRRHPTPIRAGVDYDDDEREKFFAPSSRPGHDGRAKKHERNLQDCDPPKPHYIGDGYCDSGSEYNNEACDWDGGDCCESTCEEAKYTCGAGTNPGQNHDWDCKDPSETNAGGGGGRNAIQPNCEAQNKDWIGDGFCDGEPPYNTRRCGYDGGDCCEGTCVPGPRLKCPPSAFNCRDPVELGTGDNQDPGEDEDSEEEEECDPPKPFYIGDGYCDDGPEYNNKACNWDGGDCCRDTCEEAKYTCGRSTGSGANPGQNHDWDCKDPDATDEFDEDEDIEDSEDEYPDCDVPHPEYVGDGYCDENTDDGGDYNAEDCDYDGGDCCEESCVDGDEFNCPKSKMKCRDPEYTAGGSPNNRPSGPYFDDSPGSSPNASPSANGQDNLSTQARQWLDKHNQRRKKYHNKYGYSYVPMVWSKHLERSSKDYANVLATWACEDFDHDPNNDYGENLAVIWGGDSIERVMKMWVEDEELDPNERYRSGHGHMTQCLWRATHYVGCAQSKNSECNLYVCRYIKPGNCNRKPDRWLQSTMADDSPCGPDCPPGEGCFAEHR